MDGQTERAFHLQKPKPRHEDEVPLQCRISPQTFRDFQSSAEPPLNLAWTHAHFCMINILMLCFQTNEPLKSRD